MAHRVPTTDPHYYPYAIVSKQRDTANDEGFELHFLEAGEKTAWRDHATRLHESGEFDWVRFATINLWDEETGEPLGG